MSPSFLALLDDVTSILDDVLVLSKIATRKTVGIVGDDIALNADQLIGPAPERELPVVLKVFLGSLLNKLILIPLALFLNYFVPEAIPPLLFIAGSILCIEGSKKILKFKKEEKNISNLTEEDKIKKAIRTDFILSTEIIVISLGILAGQPLLKLTLSLFVVSFLMTLGVYSFVAMILKFDDLGLFLYETSHFKKIGLACLKAAPLLLKLLEILGTWAMLVVGGGILGHTFQLENSNFILDTLIGFTVGSLFLILNKLFKRSRGIYG